MRKPRKVRVTALSAAPVCEPLEQRLLLAGDPPVITAITADNRGMIELVVDQALSPSTVNTNSVRVFTAGSDGLLGTADDRVASSTVTYDLTGKRIKVDADIGAESRYRVVVFGDQVTGANGEKLDAEFNGAGKKTGDGVAGGTLEFFTKSFALPIVRFTTFAGSFDVEMFADRTPLTVENFFDYMNDGVYDTTFFHRLVDTFVIQGGGFTASNQFSSIPQNPPVQNEPGISNLRGTIAMAKLGNNPNSATNQFFFNLGNNSGNLDQQNGGFTVFGEITNLQGLSILDALAAFETVNASQTNGAFNEIPVRDAEAFANRGFLVPQDLITITRVAEILDLSGEPFRQINTAGQVVFSSQTGATQVFLFSLNGVQLGSTSDFMDVKFSGEKLASIRFTGNIPAPIGIQIVSSQDVGSITDARKSSDSNLAFIVSSTRIGSINLRGAVSGFDINDTLLANGVLMGEDIDGDGRRDDPTAIAMLNSSIRTLTLADNLNGSVVADQGIQSVSVRGTTTNADFVLGPAADFLQTSLNFNRVTNSTLDSQTPISTFSAADWASTGQRGAGITAPSIATLRINSDFQGDLRLTGSSAARTLNSASIKGVAFLSSWNITGDVGTVSIGGGTTEFLMRVAGNLASFTTASASSTLVEVSGQANTVRASEWLSGALTAGGLIQFATTGGKGASGDFGAVTSIGSVVSSGVRSFNVKGSLTNADLSFAAPVKSFSVGGDVSESAITGTDFNALNFKRVSNTELNPTGDIGSITAWEWLGGSVFGNGLRSFNITGNRRAGADGDLTADLRLIQPNVVRVAGDIRDAQVTITGGNIFLVSGDVEHSTITFSQLFQFAFGVARATISGAMIDSTLIANRAVGDVVVGSMRNSLINIGGQANADFFSPPSAFPQNGYARSITIGRTGSQDDLNLVTSSVIGNRIDSLRIVGIDTFNGNVSFGISARSLGTVDLIRPGGVVNRFSEPTDPFFVDDFEMRPNFVAPDRA